MFSNIFNNGYQYHILNQLSNISINLLELVYEYTDDLTVFLGKQEYEFETYEGTNLLTRTKYSGIIRIKALTRLLHAISPELLQSMLNKSNNMIYISEINLQGPLYKIYKYNGDIGWWYIENHNHTQHYESIIQNFINSLNKHCLRLKTKDNCLTLSCGNSSYYLSINDCLENYGFACKRCGEYGEECIRCCESWCDNCINHRIHFC
jgi:hypothetical protein